MIQQHRRSMASIRSWNRQLSIQRLENRMLLAGDLSDPLVNTQGNTTNRNAVDPVLDVGSGHVIQMVNSSFESNNSAFQIWDKQGTLLVDTTEFATLWDNNRLVTPDPDDRCNTGSGGDPIVVFDHMADRWLLAQYHTGREPAPVIVTPPWGVCLAVSRSADPVGGENGIPSDGDEWFLYRFDTPYFPDYPKFGVWPDGYYMTSNERNRTTNERFHAFYVFDREQMLEGEPTEPVRAETPRQSGQTTLFLPSDLDGSTPKAGTPNHYLRTNNSDQIELWTAVPNFESGELVLTHTQSLPVNPFSVLQCDAAGDGGRDAFIDCIPQPNTRDHLDSLSDFTPMMQLKYRSFESYDAMIVNQTVNMQDVIQAETGYAASAEVAGIRWYELRSTDGGTTWEVHQQGDYATQPAALTPDEIQSDGQLVHRWNASAAMDGDGNIAIGYSIVNSDNTKGQELYPSIYYTGRMANDPVNTLPHGEVEIRRGTTFKGNSDRFQEGQRWGDYSALSVDPIDDCTFWYTNHVEFGRTQIASFRFSSCLGPDGYEPNDVISEATTLPQLDNAVSANTSQQGDVDYYQWTAVATGTVTIEASNELPATSNTMTLAVLDVDGNVLASGSDLVMSDSGETATRAEIQVAAGQKILIRVASSANQFFSYDLTTAFATDIPGDFDNNGTVDVNDVDLLWAARRSVEPDGVFDLNGDGHVDDQDADQMIHEILGTSYGDANLDGVFDSEDFVYVFVRGMYDDNVPLNSGWADGDWDGDGDFQRFDLVLAMQDGGYAPAPAMPAAAMAAANGADSRQDKDFDGLLAAVPLAESDEVPRGLESDKLERLRQVELGWTGLI